MRFRSSPGRTTSTYSSSNGSAADAAEEDDDDDAAAGTVPGNGATEPGAVEIG